jgi:hypothetical protein
MAFGPRGCAACIEIIGVEEHHLYPRSQGCPDDLTVWLCTTCHGRTHGMSRRMDIKQLTIAGLQAAKARGVKLGNPALAAKQAADAKARDEALRETLTSMAGLSSRAIAAKLTELGIAAPRGGAWSYQTVLRTLARLGLEA